MIWALGNTDAGGVGNGYLFATGDAYRTSIATGNWSTEQTVTSRGGAAPRRLGQHRATPSDADGVATEYLNGAPVATKTGVTITPGGIGSGVTTRQLPGPVGLQPRTSTCTGRSGTSGSTTGR